jgi:hypothetical protein
MSAHEHITDGQSELHIDNAQHVNTSHAQVMGVESYHYRKKLFKIQDMIVDKASFGSMYSLGTSRASALQSNIMLHKEFKVLSRYLKAHTKYLRG